MTSTHGTRWSEQEVALLREHYPDRAGREIAELLGRSLFTVYAKAVSLGLGKSEAFNASAASGRLAPGRLGRRGPRNWRAWTDADIEYLRAHFPHERTEDVARVLGRGYSTTAQRAQKLGLKKTREYLASEASGRLRPGDGRGAGGRFQPGHATWNKGQHHPSTGRAVETQFRVGQLPHNTRPVGTYRVSKDGYLERKYREARGGPSSRWRSVHRLVWETEHGPTPAGHVVVFLPGMKTTELADITLDRLELVTRQELMARNTVHRFPAPLAAAIQLKGALQRQINKRTRSQ